MKIIVPYNNDVSDPEVHYCVKLNLRLLGKEAEWIKMYEPNSYALLINRLWNEGEPFIILEHDVIVWRGAMEHIWECKNPICGFDGTMQCTKIIPSGECPVDPNTYWMYVDKAILDGFYFGRNITYCDHIFSTAPIINLNKQNILL